MPLAPAAEGPEPTAHKATFAPRRLRVSLAPVTAHPILVVGSMAFDDLEFPVPVPCPEDPKRTSTSFADVVGGSATFAAFAASCYAPVRVVAVVGSDFPEAVLAAMRARGIDTAGIERAAGPTFRWRGRYHDDFVGRTTLETRLGVFAGFRPRIPEAYRDSPIVLLGNIHPGLQLEVLDQVRAPALVVADTMNLWIETERAALGALLRRVGLLVVNDEEARLLSGIHNIARAARDILKQGPTRVIIKRGEHGALCFDSSGAFYAPALPLEDVCDPTGAGDSFAGGLLGYLAGRRDVGGGAVRHAILHGAATASYCVQGVGTARIASLCAAELAGRVQALRALCDPADEPEPLGS
ncbi:MAG: sugar kinase [Deltaproteobacteria bacterium]|nr:sugar kinase [Deltaproteobacteria bacterium]